MCDRSLYSIALVPAGRLQLASGPSYRRLYQRPDVGQVTVPSRLVASGLKICHQCAIRRKNGQLSESVFHFTFSICMAPCRPQCSSRRLGCNLP